MKIINQYIVKYHESHNDSEFALLFECKNNIWFIKYDNMEYDNIKKISRDEAMRLIKDGI